MVSGFLKHTRIEKKMKAANRKSQRATRIRLQLRRLSTKIKEVMLV